MGGGMRPTLSARLRAAWRCLRGDFIGYRRPLATRREAETIKFEHGGHKWFGTIGRFEDGDLAEVFLSTAKTGELLRAMANEAAILASLALQFGCDFDTLRIAIIRDGRGEPTTALGALLDKIDDSDAKRTAAKNFLGGEEFRADGTA
jgi:ribonucleoside-diphosphate reductase alpha chain